MKVKKEEVDALLLGFVRRARRYGYSTARVGAMKSLLLSRKAMQEMANAKDAGSIVSMLFQSNYKHDIEEFGGLRIKAELVDFALSKNLAKSISRLVRIAPDSEKEIMSGIFGKWDLYNIRLALEAKDSRKDFESIARYVIELGRYNSITLREAMREDSIEAMFSKLMINSPYKKILRSALEAYKKSRKVADAISAMDKAYYAHLARVARELAKIDKESSRMLRMEIDMRNILTLIRAKRMGMRFGALGDGIISKGNISMSQLEAIYNNARDIEGIASQIRLFDLKSTVEFYRKDESKRLLTFEIGIRNAILNGGARVLGSRLLSFGTMLAYMYLKEIEVSTVRILISSRVYGLERDDVARLIGWKLN